MQEPVRLDVEDEPAGHFPPPAEPHLTSVIIGLRRSPAHGEPDEPMPSQRPFRAPVERVPIQLPFIRGGPPSPEGRPRLITESQRVTVPPSRRTVPRVEGGDHLVRPRHPQIIRQPSVQDLPQLLRRPMLRHPHTGDLPSGMDPGIRASRTHHANRLTA